MTPRERVLAVLRGERPDRLPLTVYQDKFPQCAVERRLRNDGVCIIRRWAEPYVVETPNCATERIAVTEKAVTRTRTVVRTPAGEISSLSEPASGFMWIREKFFKSPSDYKALAFWVKDRRYRAEYDAFRAEELRRGGDIIARGSAGYTPLHEIMVMWMGVETFSVEWAENRDEVLKLEGLMRAKNREVYPVLADSPVTHVNYGGNETPEVMGAERFGDFCLPVYAECAAALRPKGKPLGAHLDGHHRAWAGVVARSALDYVEAFTPFPNGDMTLREALDAWPGKIIWTNFPTTLMLGPAEKVRALAQEFCELARETNRVIFGITEDAPPDLWQRNFIEIMDVVKRY